MVSISPLLPFTLALIVGIVWETIGTLPWLPIILCSIVTTTFFARNYQTTLIITIATSFFMIGALRYEQQKNQFDQFMYQACGKLCVLKGTITDIEQSYRRSGTTVTTISIEELKHRDGIIQPAFDLQLKVATRQNINNLMVGDHIELPKIYLRPCTNASYTRYLIKEQLAGHITTQQHIKVLNRPKFSLQYWFTKQRNNIIQKLVTKLSPQSFTLFASIFLGKKELDLNQMESIKEKFKIWGILHYLARSGLHVLLFMILWNWLLGFMPLPFWLKQVLLILVVLFYHIISWPSISFIRSLILFLFYKICALTNLQINTLHLLALTTIIILLMNPFQLFFLDFQLSFGLTFALCWLTHLQRKKLTS